MDLHVEISQIIFMRNSTDPRNTTHTEYHQLWKVCMERAHTHGSAIKRSVSFTILFGKAAMDANGTNSGTVADAG